MVMKKNKENQQIFIKVCGLPVFSKKRIVPGVYAVRLLCFRYKSINYKELFHHIERASQEYSEKTDLKLKEIRNTLADSENRTFNEIHEKIDEVHGRINEVHKEITENEDQLNTSINLKIDKESRCIKNHLNYLNLLSEAKNERIPLVSVIVPAYNVEKYISVCLDSILRQSMSDFELICVNDGSTDKTGRILEEYKLIDRRIKLIHQQNRGAGAARNAGIDLAKGKYLAILDADDIYNENLLLKLVAAAENDKSEITVCRCDGLDFNNERYEMSHSIKENLLPKKLSFSPKEINENLFQAFIGWSWDKLFLRSFVEKYNLKFAHMRNSQDATFVFVALGLAGTISIVPDNLVTHRMRKDSLEHTRTQTPLVFIDAIKEIKGRLEKNDIYKTYEKSFVNWVEDFCYWHYTSIGNEKQAELIKSELKKEIIPYLKTYDESTYTNLSLHHKLINF